MGNQEIILKYMKIIYCDIFGVFCHILLFEDVFKKMHTHDQDCVNTLNKIHATFFKKKFMDMIIISGNLLPRTMKTITATSLKI